MCRKDQLRARKEWEGKKRTRGAGPDEGCNLNKEKLGLKEEGLEGTQGNKNIQKKSGAAMERKPCILVEGGRVFQQKKDRDLSPYCNWH